MCVCVFFLLGRARVRALWCRTASVYLVYLLQCVFNLGSKRGSFCDIDLSYPFLLSW